MGISQNAIAEIFENFSCALSGTMRGYLRSGGNNSPL
jgi:hypothetical protein